MNGFFPVRLLYWKEIAVIRECIKGVDAKVGVMIEIQKEVLREVRRR